MDHLLHANNLKLVTIAYQSDYRLFMLVYAYFEALSEQNAIAAYILRSDHDNLTRYNVSTSLTCHCGELWAVQTPEECWLRSATAAHVALIT
jgi:hypothetical protein